MLAGDSIAHKLVVCVLEQERAYGTVFFSSHVPKITGMVECDKSGGVDYFYVTNS